MRTLFDQVGRYMRDERGAAAIEYGLIISLLVLGLISAITSIGDGTRTSFEEVSTGWGG